MYTLRWRIANYFRDNKKAITEAVVVFLLTVMWLGVMSVFFPLDAVFKAIFITFTIASGLTLIYGLIKILWEE